MMNNEYITPNLEVVLFTTDAVMTASDNDIADPWD